MTHSKNGQTTSYFAVVEGGGTKFNCAIMDRDRNIYAQTRILTTTPQVTLDGVLEFFVGQRQAGFSFNSMGVACFGPLDLNPESAQFGSLTATPKPGWSDYPLSGYLADSLGCTVALDTDVNGAALAEYRWGAAQHTDVCIYVTVGTGVGGGVVINGKPLHGLIHPEIGHMLIPPPKDIQGVCPFHGNCVEGLASGTAMGKIWQQPAETLGDNHLAWDVQAEVIAKMCHNLLLAYSPQKIILGGGVMNKPGLLPKVLGKIEDSLQGYLVMPKGVDLTNIIVLPGLGQQSGVFGALALAIDAAQS